MTIAASVVSQFFDCSTCGNRLARSEFHRNPTKRDGIEAQCRSCTADRKLLGRYGLTRVRFRQLARDQDDRCPICQDYLPGGLVVDHCHSDGRVRGLLCSKCNIALGLLREDPAVINRAADYITTPPPPTT